MARAAAERLAAIDGVEVLTPLDRMATLVTFRIARLDAAGRARRAQRPGVRGRPDRAAHRRAADQRRLLHLRRRARSVHRRASSCSRRTRPRRSAATDADDPQRWLTARADVRQRSWAEIRWRQFRNAPATGRARRCCRACRRGRRWPSRTSSTTSRSAVAPTLPGGDLRLLALVALHRAGAGRREPSSRTSSSRSRRAPGRSAAGQRWSAALGFFAAVPIAWLVMVVALQVVRPLARLIALRPTRVLLQHHQNQPSAVRPGSLSVPFPGTLRRSHHPRVSRGRTGDVALIR